MSDTVPTDPKPWPLVWMSVFLAALRNSANVRASCQAAGINRRMSYLARDKYATFRAAWDEAVEDAVDVLEAEAWSRARGQSDFLLWRLLASRRRDLYGDRVKLEGNLADAVRALALRDGLTDDETEAAVAEAVRTMKAHARAR